MTRIDFTRASRTERAMLRGIDDRIHPPPKFRPAGPAHHRAGGLTAGHDFDLRRPSMPPASGSDIFGAPLGGDVVNGRAIKATIVLDAGELAPLVVPEGVKQWTLRIVVGASTVITQLNARNARRAIAAIGAHGVDNAVVYVQGRLEGNTLVAAALTVHPKPQPEAK